LLSYLLKLEVYECTNVTDFDPQSRLQSALMAALIVQPT